MGQLFLAVYPSLLDAGGFTAASAQVIQFGPAYLSVADYFYSLHPWGVQRERALHTDTIGDASDGKGGADTAPLQLDDHALEGLETLLATFNHFDVNAYRIPGGEFGNSGIALDID
ncbi:hypothetical protein ES703_124068 [subsurface metagenome]